MSSSDKTQHLQKQVDDVMKRGESLTMMKHKVADLEEGAKAFGGKASRVKNKMWWQNVKMKLLIAAIILVVLLIIIVPLCVKKS